MNEGIGTKVKSTELPKSLSWYYEDLLKILVIPTLGMLIVLAVLGLFKDQFYSVFKIDTYLVWHNIFEFSSVVGSFAIFLLSWYTYGQLGNRRELFIGVAFLIVGSIDFMHALSFPGMPAFVSQNSTNKAINYWIVARLIQAAGLAFSGFIPTRINKSRFLRAAITIGALSFIALTFSVVTYLPDRIPAMFVPDKGLTPTKIWLEYTVIFLILVAISKYAMIYRQTRGRESRILLIGLTFFVFSELSFTLYASAFDTYNLLGHIFKIGITVSAFVALFVSSVQKPFIERKRAEEALKEHSERLEEMVEELERSNTELEQFAYVASHDLQEPLRMVSSYMQLLEKRYRGRLDDDADEFIAFAVDGAKRLQILIKDLLAFSRVKSRGKSFETTDSEWVLERVLTNLGELIRENNATVTHDRLPAVMADEVQLEQVFQNLLGNAIKFHSEVPPEIHIGAERTNGEWKFSVHDNGIGIEPRYYERIFVIFQRLHSGDKYPGTGIGLAISKRIIERHGGRIWVETAPGGGSTFFFTLPLRGE